MGAPVNLDPRAVAPARPLVDLDPSRLDAAAPPLHPALVEAAADFRQAVNEHGARPDVAADVAKARLVRDAPELLTEEPAARGPGFISTRLSGPAPVFQDKTFRQQMETPLVDISQDLDFLVGPFGLHRGAIEVAQQTISPGNLMIAVASGGLASGARALAASKALATSKNLARMATAGSTGLQTALSGYFGIQLAEGALKNVPEAAKAYREGDWEKLFRIGGQTTAEGFLAYRAAKHVADVARAAQPVSGALEDLYRQEQAAKRPSERDIGAGGTRGPIEPEIVPEEPAQRVRRRLRAAPEPIDLNPEEVTPVPEPQPRPTPQQRPARPPVETSRQAPQTSGPAAAPLARLPRDLAGAKPRYKYGETGFDLDFADDLDKAAYISAQPNKSKRDADYLQFAIDRTGLDEQEVRALGGMVRAQIKAMARGSEGGRLQVEPVVRGFLERQGRAGNLIAQTPGEPEPVRPAPTEQRATREVSAPQPLPTAVDLGRESPPGPPKPLEAEQQGTLSKAKTARGSVVETKWALVDADQLVTSHDPAGNENPAYPQEVQPRDRTRVASQAQVAEMAGRLDPEQLGESYNASEGAPIVGPDLVVESGNGRTNALRLAYGRNLESAGRYRDWVKQMAPELGIKADPSAMKRPVLVRVRRTPVDRAQFALEANEAAVASRSATELAATDSGKLAGALMESFRPGDDGNVLGASNRDFVRHFFDQVVGPNERAQYMAADGSINQAGAARVRSAVFAKAYGESGALEKLAESTDSNIRNITDGMLDAAPRFAAVAEGIRRGDLHQLDLSGDVGAAAGKLSALRESGERVEDYLKQESLFGEDLTPEAKELLGVFATYGRSPRKIGEVLRSYTDAVEALGSPKQESIFGGEIPSKLEVLQAAIHSVKESAHVQSPLRQGQAARGREGAGAAAQAPGPEEPARTGQGRGQAQLTPKQKIVAKLEAELAEAKAAGDKPRIAQKERALRLVRGKVEQGATGQIFRAPRLREHGTASNVPEYLEAADAKYEALIEGRPGHVYLNAPAHDLTTEAIRHSGLPAQPFAGLTLGPREANQVYRKLGEFQALEQRPPVVEAIERIRSAFREAAKDAQVLTLVRTGAPVSRLETRTARREEEFHRQQILANRGRAMHVNPLRLARSPEIRKALRAIQAERQETGQRAYLELGAAIAGGQWPNLGLSRDEAAEAMYRYLREVERLHGADPRAMMRYIDPHLREVIHAKFGHTRTDRELARGTLRSLRSKPGGPGSGSGSAQFYSPLRGRGPGPRSLSAEVRRDLPAGSLFGEEVAAETRAAASRDADRLLGERLTAQFRSGAPFKPSKKAKPAETQTDLFNETPEERQPGLFGSERGSLPVSAETAARIREAGARLANVFAPAGPRANYSGLGAAQDVFVRNLSQLERADPQAHAAAVRAAASRGQAAVILRAAVPRIEAALGEQGPSWKEMRAALVESRLRGIRARWRRMASEADGSTPKRMQAAVDGGLFGLLEQIEGKRGIPQDVSQTAAALYEQTFAGELEQKKAGGPAAPIPSAGPQFDALKSFIAQTFRDAAATTARILPDEEFNRIAGHPSFDQGLEVYRDLVEAPMAESHALNEGVFSSALGPLGTYYPLVPVTQADENAAKLVGKATPYRKPRNISNDFATGLAENYDLEMEALRNRLERAVKTNNKAALIQTLEDRGLVRVLKPNERAGDTIEIGGVEYRAKAIEVGGGYSKTSQGGKGRYVETREAVMPAWLARELEPILERRGEAPGRIRRVMDALNTFSLVGPLDLAYHSQNLIGTMVANTPFLPNPNRAIAVLGNTPLTKIAHAVIRIVRTDPTTTEAVRDLQHMAQLGLVPDRFGSETYSRTFAEQTGARLAFHEIGPVRVPTGFGPVLYGPKGIDVRARLAMYRIAREIDPTISDRELARFVNQLGAYVRGLQGTVERTLKSSGLSPFYTAGSTMMRNGINAFLGRGPITSDRFSYRVAQQLTGGAVGMIALWVAAYRAYRGKWPWEENEAKLLQIPVKGADRASPAGRALYGTKKGPAYVNFAFFNPLVARGGRALGVQGAFEARRLRGNAGQMANAAATGFVDSAIHPAAGPIANAATIALTGHKAAIASMQPFAALPAAKHFSERPVEAARALNKFLADVAGASGLGQKPKPGQERGNRWLRMMTDVTMPRLFGTVSDQEAKARRLQAERRAAERRK